MKLRNRYLPFIAMLGVCVAAPSALAAPTEVKLEVNENCVDPDWPCWATVGSSQPASKIVIASGGSIVYVDDRTAANIAWTGTAPTCEAAVPLAPAAAKTGWEGKCVFATPGTYRFESSTLWPEYTKYEVVVEGSATTGPSPGPTGESGSKDTSPPGGGASSPTADAEVPGGSPLSAAPAISQSQRGATVKGSLQISKVGAGDRLVVELVASTASLASAGHATEVVGRSVSAPVSAGQRPFSVKLNARAKRALKRHHRLALKVKITLTPAHGQALSITRSVTLRA